MKALKGRRQKAEGRSGSARPHDRASRRSHFCLLPSAFCLTFCTSPAPPCHPASSARTRSSAAFEVVLPDQGVAFLAGGVAGDDFERGGDLPCHAQVLEGVVHHLFGVGIEFRSALFRGLGLHLLGGGLRLWGDGEGARRFGEGTVTR